MSSSTTGVLGRGKLGATGEGLGLAGLPREGYVSKQHSADTSRPILPSHGTSFTSTAPVHTRRPSNGPGSSPIPQLFDFAKTDRRPPNGRSITGPAASLPSHLHLPPPIDDVELDMAFDGDEEDDEGSAELEMEMDEDEDGEVKPEWKKLALGTGSGGVKGRRKGMVFKCENCAKVGKSKVLLTAGIPSSKLFD